MDIVTIPFSLFKGFSSGN